MPRWHGFHRRSDQSSKLVLADVGIGAALAGLHYALAAMLWSASFAIWLIGFWPILNAGKGEDSGCG
ncbi:hypothetical protein DK26_19485 [Bosea sp. WAO]|nr:hypothetical protein DK26_19485 [Bosea sp. WAO]